MENLKILRVYKIFNNKTLLMGDVEE